MHGPLNVKEKKRNTSQLPNTHNPPELGKCPIIDTYRLGAQIYNRLMTSTKIHIHSSYRQGGVTEM
jgi:hypothetical protein